MGTATAAQIINKVAIQLGDQRNLKWSRAELLNWLSEAQRTVCAERPRALASLAATALVAGARQTLPSDCVQLLDVYNNIAANGTTAGGVVRRVSRSALDAYTPTWHQDTSTDVVTDYIYEEEDKDTYWVYPPSNGATYLQINYAKAPPNITSEAATISIDDAYEATLVDYVMYRAHLKAVEGAGGPQVAAMYFQAFTGSVGTRATIDKQASDSVGD